MTDIVQGGIYQAQGGAKLIALQPAYANRWWFFQIGETILMPEALIVTCVKPWTDPPPAPKLVTWYRPIGCRISGGHWYTPDNFYKNKTDGFNVNLEVLGWEERELPE